MEIMSSKLFQSVEVFLNKNYKSAKQRTNCGLTDRMKTPKEFYEDNLQAP
jgi:hypothetical protein